ncbi:hypothetical protein ACPWSR_08740 [Alloiococcus sp. CFN-8]|uniref:hypothetical protein n=1 Tax=Alloiococcus sp. CFN-8 TaxID=3416081 RepID=UPI003CF3BB5E
MFLSMLTYLIIFIFGSYTGFRSVKKLKPFYYDSIFIALAIVFLFIGVGTRIVGIFSYEIYFSTTFFWFFMGNFVGRLYKRISLNRKSVRG